MDLFSPSNLPGVGMGDLTSVAAVFGLIGLAVTSGALIAEGAIGTIVFVLSAVALLQQKDEFAGGAAPFAIGTLIVLLLVTAATMLVDMRARRDAAGLVGAAADAAETKAARASIKRRERWARILTLVAVAAGGAAVGYAWAEWNEVPFHLEDTEAFVGLGLGLVFALVGGEAAARFARGSIRAGGHPIIVGIVIVVVAFIGNALSEYVPFAGAVVLVLATVLAIRLRRRSTEKHAGLRILR